MSDLIKKINAWCNLQLEEVKFSRRVRKLGAQFDRHLFAIRRNLDLESANYCAEILEKKVAEGSDVGKDPDNMVQAMRDVSRHDKELFYKVVDMIKERDETTYISWAFSGAALTDKKLVERVYNLFDANIDKRIEVSLGVVCQTHKAIEYYLDFIDRNQDRDIINACVSVGSIASSRKDVEFIVPVINYNEKFLDHKDNKLIADTIAYVVSFNKNRDRKYFLDIFDQYKNNNIASICTVIKNHLNSLEDLDFRELRSDMAYEAIKNAKNPYAMAKKIMTQFPFYYRNQIEDVDFRDKVGYEDIDLIKNCWELNKEIHSRKKEEYITDMRTGYFTELNRAISQDDDFEGKRRMLRDYCKEVTEQLRKRAEELMFNA